MKRLDNKGLSLIELIIAISMATIVIGAASMFMYSAERSYRTAEYSIDLQMEAQLLMEQMSNWVMESNYIKVGGTAPTNYLVLYKIPRPTVDDTSLAPVARAASRKIIYMYGDKLYIKMDTETVAGTYETEIKNDSLDLGFLSTAPDEIYCIGEYTQTFSVALPSDVDESKINSIYVELGMHEGVAAQSKDYTIANRFSIRNDLFTIEDDDEDDE